MSGLDNTFKHGGIQEALTFMELSTGNTDNGSASGLLTGRDIVTDDCYSVQRNIMPNLGRNACILVQPFFRLARQNVFFKHIRGGILWACLHFKLPPLPDS